MGELNFEKLNGLIPAVVQDADTYKVLMVGFMTPEAYKKTVQTRQVTFWSRKNKRLWTKGEKSGNFLNVVRMVEDCDHDTVLIYARPAGPVCHKGYDTCFNETNVAPKDTDDMIGLLEGIIAERKKNPNEGSYTSKLFAKGINKIAQKLGEEAIELVIEAKDNDKDLFMGEAADLMYHFLVLLQAKGYSLKDVEEKLRSRYVKK
ncbi:MAG TPA: bifunctional phosphoribosyl-AMP cyclohydrolase/phosphoribosyl-ATP diphosphatase HisIE [Flavobacteriales bacterium]|nr:bifunctional phosphoribosyl-AMP cyclohydrolase/phosphoribosyl-ATP diphosphatase HisIE [Flavobacteriales bacterium]